MDADQAQALLDSPGPGRNQPGHDPWLRPPGARASEARKAAIGGITCVLAQHVEVADDAIRIMGPKRSC
ncbi:MAG: hypothetical protein LBE86_12535 [Gemmobacter sp.]|nr:hypothetical protein [Gemmobacter sp.]